MIPVAQKRSTGVRQATPWLRFLQAWGLQGKLILGFLLLITSALALVTCVFVGRSRAALTDILGEQARQISQTLAMAAETPYHANNLNELKRLGTDLLKSRNIVLVVFSDAAGNPISVSCRDPEYKEALDEDPKIRANTRELMLVQQRTLPSLGDFMQVTAPVLDVSHGARARMAGGSSTEMRKGGSEGAENVRLLGYISVGISKAGEQAQLQRITVLGIALGCLACLISLPIASGIVHRIFLPIRQLVSATNRIAGGDYDAQVATHRPDEIGQLARSFNDMVERIRESQQALRIANEQLAEANRDLEAKVHQRTRELESANKRLSAEIAEKEDFLRAVSHDLNAPLRNISGMAQMLLMKYKEKFDEEIVHRLERIRKNVEVETDLISELLELSRIKTRRQKLEPVEVGALIRDLEGMFEDDLKQRGIELLLEAEPPVITCERARLRQVFQNLIDNAIKYMGDIPNPQIRIGHTVREDEVEFHVADTGIGIDRDDIGKVFYIFRRGRNSGDIKVAGKGVGLASVKSIIETYNGRIWVESEIGQGSTFRFTINRKFVPMLQQPLSTNAPEASLCNV